jgi:raffinose/stachyose/melibiose transport system substrate-binding protein
MDRWSMRIIFRRNYMREKVSVVCLVLFFLVGVFAFAGGGSQKPAAGSGVPNELNFYVYYADSDKLIVDNTLAALKPKYPNLKVNVEHRADSDGSTLKTRAAVGEMPDIYDCVGNANVDAFIKSGDMLVLDEYIQKSGLFNNFTDNSFASKKAPDGHYYALMSLKPESFLLFYNISVFKDLGLQPAKNFNEMKNLVSALVKAGKMPLALFAAEQWPGLQLFDLAVIGSGQPGGITAIDEGTARITDPAYVAAARKLKELVDLGFVGRGALNTNHSQALELEASGQAGMVGTGTWLLDSALSGGYIDNVGFFSYNPFADPGKEEEVRGHTSGGTPKRDGLAVYAKGKYPDFAAQFLMDYIVEHAKVLAKMGIFNSLKNPPAPDKPQPAAFKAYGDSLGGFKSTTNFSWALSNAEVLVALGDAVERLLTGSYSADQFIADLDRQLSAVKR